MAGFTVLGFLCVGVGFNPERLWIYLGGMMLPLLGSITFLYAPLLTWWIFADKFFAMQNGIPYPRAKFFPLIPAYGAWIFSVTAILAFLQFLIPGAGIRAGAAIWFSPLLLVVTLALAFATHRRQLAWAPNVKVAGPIFGLIVLVHLSIILSTFVHAIPSALEPNAAQTTVGKR